jgi:hypothetical protein
MLLYFYWGLRQPHGRMRPEGLGNLEINRESSDTNSGTLLLGDTIERTVTWVPLLTSYPLKLVT